MADPKIKFISMPYQGVVALLQSESLRNIEEAIATAVGRRIVEDYSTASTSYTLADMSVSGMTLEETEALLVSQRDQIVAFGIALLRDETATSDTEVFPDGEEQDPSEIVEVHGLGVGFGIKYAIYWNFLANRTAAEFRAYLKNRRIPTQFARELRRVFENLQ